MNERFRELLKQSTNPPWDGEQGPMNEFNLERFAESIVRECYESCRSQVLDKETADTNELTYNDAVGDCAIGLLQHFGMME
jgi:hypothetical protein